jgi:hypothetical protein
MKGKVFLSFLFHTLVVSVGFSQALSKVDYHQIDSLLNSEYKGRPGVAVIAVKDGDILFYEGYGLSNIDIETSNSQFSLLGCLNPAYLLPCAHAT